MLEIRPGKLPSAAAEPGIAASPGDDFGARLTPAEVRFRRTTLGWSGKELADHMGATAETVSRWEHGRIPMGPQADRLLRLMVLHTTLPASFDLSQLKDVARQASADLRTRLIGGKDGWTTEAAPPSG